MSLATVGATTASPRFSIAPPAGIKRAQVPAAQLESMAGGGGPASASSGQIRASNALDQVQSFLGNLWDQLVGPFLNGVFGYITSLFKR